MCCGAAYWEQLGKIVYGASDVKRHVSELHDKILHPKTEVVGGVLKEQCEVVYLERTPEISTTKIKEDINKK